MSSYDDAIKAMCAAKFGLTTRAAEADALAAAWPHLIKPFAELADQASGRSADVDDLCEQIRALIDDIEQASNR